ncbi:hypothetical protein SAMN06296241_1358 [Salinimicrobium sediminis]|uniref:Uncharacterized protein n=1 Tax=Salinimicrobium sediminis TaxID=1343891 RepID=A0A285X389_9FLAO|nr:hypothetical protein [Salinimicrobium sediminis]SOC79821.1 hypothetical protein SAMN06296241_1358 [Salinimicrobium sediminis]
MDWREIDKAAIFTGKDENGNRYLSQFLKDYKDTFHPDMINAGCSKCLEDYYQKFIKHLSTMSKKDTNSGYKLRAKYNGIPLEFGSPVQVSNANLTDELAQKLLKNHPAGEDLFETIPEGNEPAEKTRLEELKDMKRPELDKLAETLELNPKDYSNKDLISEAIEQKEIANLEVKE